MHTSTMCPIELKMDFLGHLLMCLPENFGTFAFRSGLNLTPVKNSAPEIINLRHLEWFYLVSDVPSRRT